MQVDISLSNVKIYNISRVDVVKGQKFKLITDSPDKIEWFSNGDAFLSFVEHDKSADVEATATGRVLVKLFKSDFSGVEKTLEINVLDSIQEPAADLGLSASDPELK